MKLILILLVLIQFAFGATTTHRTDKLKLGKSVGEDIYIYADNGNANLPFLFFDFSAGLWKQSNDGTSSEVIGGSSVITTEGDLIVGNASNVDSRLPIGTVGQLLTADGTTAAWQDAPISTTLDTKGQIQTFTTVNANLDVGTDGEFLVADSAEATGLKWSNQLQGVLNPVTDSQSYTPPISGITLGNGTLEGEYSAIGDKIHFMISITWGSTTSGTGSFAFGLPNSYTANLNGAGSKVMGSGYCQDIGTAANRKTCVPRINNGSNSFIMLTSGSGAASTTVPFTWTTGDTLYVTGVVPVNELTSNLDAVVQNKKLVNLSYAEDTGYSTTSNITKTLTFDTMLYDNSGGAFNGATGVFTAPHDGKFLFCPKVELTATTAWTDGEFIELTLEGASDKLLEKKVMPYTNTGVLQTMGAGNCAEVELLQGQTESARVFQNSGSGIGTNGIISNNYISITEIASTGVIAGTFAGHVLNSHAISNNNNTVVESCYITDSGTPATNNTLCGTWIDSVSDFGNGLVTWNITPGTFTGTPICTCSANSAGAGTMDCSMRSATNSTLASQVAFNGTATDRPVHMICVGQR